MVSNLSKQRHLLTQVSIQQMPFPHNTRIVGKLERQVPEIINNM